MPQSRVVHQIPDHPLDGAGVVDDALDDRQLLFASASREVPLEEPRGGEHDAEGIAHVVAQDAEDPIAEVQRRAQLGRFRQPRGDVDVHGDRADHPVAEADGGGARPQRDVLAGRGVADQDLADGALASQRLDVDEIVGGDW